jgi:hypothetical protein
LVADRRSAVRGFVLHAINPTPRCDPARKYFHAEQSSPKKIAAQKQRQKRGGKLEEDAGSAQTGAGMWKMNEIVGAGWRSLFLSLTIIR